MPDPFEKTLEQLLDGRDVSRRHFVRTLGASALAVSSAGTLLAACGGTEGTDKGGDASKAVSVNHPKTDDRPSSTSRTGRSTSTRRSLKDFEKKYGGKAKYVEDINDNDEFFGKVQEPLRRGRSIDRDIVVADRLDGRALDPLGLGRADRQEATSRTRRTSSRRCASPKFDPKRQYTLPWQSGMTAIGYNPKKTGRKLKSVNDLFDPKFKGRVTMLQDWRDSAGARAARRGQEDRRRRRSTTSWRRSRRSTRRRQGPDPPLHRQRLHAAASRSGDLWVVGRLLGRRGPAQGRQPGARVPDPRGGRAALDRQHADAAEAAAPVRRRDDDELRLRPGGGGARSRRTSTT